MDNWILGRRWNVLQTSPNSEALAATSAKEMGYEVFWPRYREKRLQSHRKPVELIRSFIPGYLFVVDARYAHDGRSLSLWELGKAKGVMRIVKNAGVETINDTDPIMQLLLKMADDDGFVKAEIAKKPIFTTTIKQGDKVKITEGPFMGFLALVEGVSKDRTIATIWIEIFGGKTLAEMYLEHLKPLQPRKVAA